ncbi:hypothetical protein [Haloarcula rubripromontorii]|uniref:hypothetical protein n=1 Tax=Haloarcula rubripromontorii TaxID=1705562 RepID=UPI00345C2A2C
MSQPGLAPEPAQLVRGHPDAMADVPTEPFTLRELPSADAKQLVKRLSDTKVLSAEFVMADGAEVLQYELTEMGQQRRAAVIDTGYRPLPCNHVGLRNIDSQTFECCWDACDETFDRAEVNLDA